MNLFSKNATVVLVHGAWADGWADGSSWNRVILPLLHQGLKVICAPIPLTSLSDHYGKPEEIAELMAFLVSPGAKWLTGTSVRIDGGEIKGI